MGNIEKQSRSIFQIKVCASEPLLMKNYKIKGTLSSGYSVVELTDDSNGLFISRSISSS
jgi:hypothetical protein